MISCETNQHEVEPVASWKLSPPFRAQSMDTKPSGRPDFIDGCLMGRVRS